MIEPFDEKLIEAYYAVAANLRSTGANMIAQGEYLAQIADRMSEERAGLQQDSASSTQSTTGE